MTERNKNVVVWDSQTAITEPDRYTDEQGADDVDEEDSADEKQMQKSTIFCVESAIFLRKNFMLDLNLINLEQEKSTLMN